MAATSSDINQYIWNVRTASSDYIEMIAKARQLGKKTNKCWNPRLALLMAFIEIVVDYFDSDDYTVSYFTTEEIKDIMQHINNICDTKFWIDNL